MIRRRLLTPAVSVAVALAFIGITGSPAAAYQNFFATYCQPCHSDDTPTCNGCHHHMGTLRATADAPSYTPGAPVTVTLNGGTQRGWIRAILYDQNHHELTRATGPDGTGDNGQPHPVVFPVLLTATAPLLAGDYVWQAAWYGNDDSAGHIERGTNVTIHVVRSPAGVAGDRPVVGGTWGRIRGLYSR